MKPQFLLNPETGEIFNATEDLVKHMVKLRLTPCPEEILRIKRPDLFVTSIPAGKSVEASEIALSPSDSIPMAEDIARANELNVRTLPPEAPVGDGEGDGEEDESGAVIDENRLTLLVEAIETLDPATGFTKDGLPIPGKLAKAIGSRVTTGERDAAWIEYQFQKRG